MGTGRLEAFSDGVMAVAITLLALEITVPELDAGHGLGHALLVQWPQYLAYAVSFLTIGIIWVNHHAMLGRLREADHSILVLNLLLLMTICVLPFATDLVAHYLRSSGGAERVAAAVYAGIFALMAIAFVALIRHILLARPQLLAEPVELAHRRRILRSAAAGVIPYLAAVGLAFVSPYATLGICGALALYYAFPLASRGPSARMPGGGAG